MAKLETITAEDLQNRTYEPTHFLVDELIPEGLHILAGAPKIGKSWLALWLCLCISQGQPLWNFATTQGEVLYLSLEDSFQRTTVLVDTLNCLSDRIRQKTEFYVPLGESSGVYPFVIGGRKPFVLLIPGGAYAEVCTLNEGFMMALALNRMGWNAFVCKYRVGKEAHFPNPQDDVADCLQWIFQNAAQMEVNTEDYAVCGFSAGGHLAASWGAKALGYRKYALPRPKTIILAYPVITMGRKTHNLSRKNLLGDRQDDPEYQRLYSIENQVDAEYPDTFLWACEADKCVPFENTRLMAEALRKSGCRVEVRSYKGTAHGWGLAAGTPANGWLTQAIDFWQS